MRNETTVRELRQMLREADPDSKVVIIPLKGKPIERIKVDVSAPDYQTHIIEEEE